MTDHLAEEKHHRYLRIIIIKIVSEHRSHLSREAK